MEGGAFNGRLVGVNGGGSARGHIRGGAQVLYAEVVERKVVAVLAALSVVQTHPVGATATHVKFLYIVSGAGSHRHHRGVQVVSV